MDVSPPSDCTWAIRTEVEEDGEVTGRYKFIRAGFLQTVLDSGSHWIDRPLPPNRLRGSFGAACLRRLFQAGDLLLKHGQRPGDPLGLKLLPAPQHPPQQADRSIHRHTGAQLIGIAGSAS